MNNNLDNFERELKSIVDAYQPDYVPNSWQKLNKKMNSVHSKWYYLVAFLAVVSVSSMMYLNLNKLAEENVNDNQNLLKSSSLHQPDFQTQTASKKEYLIMKQVEFPFVDKKEQRNSVYKKLEGNSDISIVEDTMWTDNMPTDEFNNTNNKVQDEDIVDNQPEEKSRNLENPEIVLSKKEGCQPLIVDFSISVLPKDAVIKWVFSDGFVSTSEEIHHQFVNSGIYNVKLTILSQGEKKLVEEKVIVKKSPEVDFRYTINNGLLSLENLSSDVEEIQWAFLGNKTMEESPVFKLQYSDDYLVSVKITNSEFCSSQKKKIISYKVDHHIFAPNAFSPDGDGVNDEFFVRYEPQEGYLYTLQIFNALGNKMFESKDINNAWDGKCAGVKLRNKHEKFLWRLIIRDLRGVEEIKEGYFESLEH